MLYSRWGGLGNHRYPIGFSGDTYATWESLRFPALLHADRRQRRLTAGGATTSAGISGATDPELYARWVQFGAVSPCLRLHSTKDPLAERRPWAFPAPVYEAAKAAFQLPLPTAALPVQRGAGGIAAGLVAVPARCTTTIPTAEDAYLAREQYFLGDQMIAAPVVHAR